MRNTDYLGAFNAHWLTPVQVAQRFVPVDQFTQLLSSNNSVLMGPRGSGKTTLLKMLQPEAIKAWNTGERQRLFRKRFKEPAFIPLYIPADVRWSFELSSIETRIQDSDLVGRIQRLLVQFNALSQVCIAASLQLNIKRKAENSACVEIIRALELRGALPLFQDIAFTLEARAAKLRGLLSLDDIPRLNQFLSEQPVVFYAQILDPVVLTCRRLLEFLPKELNKTVWGLCWDELETAPEWLRQELWASLRSGPQGFLLKLTASPLLPTGVKTRPEAAADYRAIRLWSSHVLDTKRFCTALTQDFLSERYGDNEVTPEQFLGKSHFAEEAWTSDGRIIAGSRFEKTIHALQEKDPTFRAQLKTRHLDSRALEDATAAQKDEFLRKIKPVVILRNETIGTFRRRSRKILHVYSGTDVAYSMSEANPRWLLGLLSDLHELGSPLIRKSPMITPARQAAILLAAAQRFVATLKSFPTPPNSCDSDSGMGLYDFIQKLGRLFSEEIHGSEFKLDPVGSITIKAKPSPRITKLVELGLELGGLVFVGGNSLDIPSQMEKSKIRLSWMLAPIFKLPLRNYREIELPDAISQLEAPNQPQLNINE